jgi:HTH-type transcriptional regulator/antitoxin HigA
MDIRPIRRQQDYRAALRKIAQLMESDPALGTPEGDALDVLATLVEAYESKHFPIELPDPVEAIRFRMGQAGLTAKDLVPAGRRRPIVGGLKAKSADNE